MNRDDRAEPIVRPAEHHLQLMLFEFGARRGERSFGLAGRVGILGAFFLGHLEKHARLLEAIAQALESLDLAFKLVLFLQDALRVLGRSQNSCLLESSRSSFWRAVSLGRSKTPPELVRAGFEIAQLFSDVADHVWVFP